MASVTVALTGYSDQASATIGWLDDVSLGATFDANGALQTLTSIFLYYADGGLGAGSVSIQIDGTNNRFTPAFEATGRIIFEASDGEMLEAMIADADMTEPYQWTPSNAAEVITFANHVRGLTDQDATLTLTDDPPATDHEVDGGNLEWGFELPEATVTHTPAPTLALSDFDDSGLDVEAAALLEASAPGTAGNNLYADSDRGGTDSPLEGELGLGPDDVVISRIRHGSETVLSLNDNNNPVALALDDFFEGDGNGLTLYLQTEADGVVSFDVADQLSGNRNSSTVRFTLPADAQTLLNNIPDGGRWIFALAQATPVAQDHEVAGGDLTWGFEIPEATVTHTPAAATADHAVNGGDLDWGFELPEATITIVRGAAFDHEVDGGNLEWGFAIPQATVTLVAAGPVDHAVDGGNLSWGFHLRRATVRHVAAATYVLEVDWDNDGSYGNSRADVWPQARQGTFKCWRGRNFASQRIGLSIAGTLSVELDNRDGLYDPTERQTAPSLAFWRAAGASGGGWPTLAGRW